MVLSFGMLIPAVWLVALLTVFLCLTRTNRLSWLPFVFRMAEALDPWAMPDVFMVGAAVAYSGAELSQVGIRGRRMVFLRPCYDRHGALKPSGSRANLECDRRRIPGVR